MKKIFFAVILMIFLPVLVQAEECTQEMMNGYSQYIDKIKITYEPLGESGTYGIWASYVTGGIALEHGRIVFDQGFLGYGSQDESFDVRVYVADGSLCAGTTLKNIQLYVPKKEIVTPTPIPEPTPPNTTTENNNSNNSSNNNDKPTNNISDDNITIISEDIENTDNSTIDNDEKEVISEENSANDNDEKVENSSEDVDNKSTLDYKLKIYIIIIICLVVSIVFLIIIRNIFKKTNISRTS